jgi:3-hydroxyacyl-CoA dehydrogenase
VVILGAGQIGRSWAIAFASAGDKVLVIDPDAKALSDARQYIETALEGLPARLKGIEFRAEAQDLREHELLFECVSEDLELKRRVHTDLERMIGAHTTVLSATSSFPGSEFISSVAHRDRFLVAHPINPPHLLPLVELCPTPWTREEISRKVFVRLQAIGKRPIIVRGEIPYFIANRLQAALLGEAMALYAAGVGSAEDIDSAIKYGFGRRLATMGVFEMLHLNTDLPLDDYLLKHGVRHVVTAVTGKPSWTDDDVRRLGREREAQLPSQQIPQRRAWRDRCLAAIAELVESLD